MPTKSALNASVTSEVQRFTNEILPSRHSRTVNGVVEAGGNAAHQCPGRGRSAISEEGGDLLHQTEEARHDSEACYRAVFEQAGVGVAHTALDGRWLEVNARLCDILGYAKEELLGCTFQEVTHPDDLPGDLSLIQALDAGEIPSFTREKRYIRKDGSTVWVSVTVSLVRDPSGAPAYRIGIIQDINDRKRAEEALRESEQRLRATYEHAFVGISEVDVSGRFSRVNEQFCSITGYSRDELLGRTFDEITHPDDRGPDLEHFCRQMAGDISAYTLEKRYQHKDGHAVWVGVSASRVDDLAGRPLYGVRVVRDISGRKRFEAALRESEDHYRHFVELNPQMPWTADPDGKIVDISSRWLELTGLSKEQALGDGWVQVVHPDDLPRMLEAVARSRETGEPLDIEHRRRFADGEYGWMRSRAFARRDEQGNIVRWYGTTEDIHDRKLAEEHLNLLVHELNHRVKNTLATVQAITRQTLRNAASPEQALADVEGRLLALARAHDVLTRENWDSANLWTIIAEALAPYGGVAEGRFHVEGPGVRVAPRTALALAMAFQELATNAVKYGALSNDTGQIAVTWSVDRNGDVVHLRLRWTEAGGPTVQVPRRHGFGTRLIERGLASDLGGEVRIDFAPAGLVCVIDVPLPI